MSHQPFLHLHIDTHASSAEYLMGHFLLRGQIITDAAMDRVYSTPSQPSPLTFSSAALPFNFSINQTGQILLLHAHYSL